MTTTDSPGTFARAERSSRWFLLVVCGGILAWVIGALISVRVHEAFAEPIESAVDTGAGLIVEHWVFQHLWFVITLAPAAYLAGRFMGGSRAGFIALAVTAGELFDFALAFLRDGTPFDSWEDVAGWALSWVFIVPAFFAFRRGERAHERSVEVAKATAAQRTAEYEAFLAKAKGDESKPPPSGP